MKTQPWRLATPLFIVLLSLTGLASAQRPPCPQHCTCFPVGFVSCYNFTEDSLRNLPPRINTIVLQGGSIRSFPPGFLSQSSRIDLLEIQSCQVDTILNNTFSGFTALDLLAISECKIGSIERGAFSNVTNMSKLYLSSSQIGTIHAGAFSRLNEFGDFSMWSNDIETIEPAAFSQMSDLHALSFYMNNVTTLAPDAFDQVRKLGKLEIYLNHFQHLATGRPFFPILNTAQEISVYSNTFPCDCGIEDDAFVNETLINRILTSNRCLKDGEIYQLSELPALNICEERVNMTTVSTPKPTTTPFTTKNTATTSVTTTASSQQGDISTKPSSSAPFTKTSLGTSAGTDVTRSGTDVTTTRSASSSTPGKEGKVDNGGSERETDSRSSGNSVASKATIVGLTVVPAVIAVGLFIQLLRVRSKRRQARLQAEGGNDTQTLS